jgi:hypothetical protein
VRAVTEDAADPDGDAVVDRHDIVFAQWHPGAVPRGDDCTPFHRERAELEERLHALGRPAISEELP